MPFRMIRQDITKMRVCAAVNAANTALKQGGGVCGAIFEAAGVVQLQEACDKLAPITTGEAVVTPGFNLPARHIIHTAGPVYRDGQHHEKELLQDCYWNSLQRAVEIGCKSVAFPLIASGIYGYPKAEALQVATQTIRKFLENNTQDLDVFLAVFDKQAFNLSEQLLGDVQSYIDDHYAGRADKRRRSRMQTESWDTELREIVDVETRELPDIYFSVTKSSAKTSAAAEAMPAHGLDEWIEHLDEPFSATLIRLIDAKGKSDVEIYKRANLDRKLFSKIRSNKGYMPSKRTAIALAIALELDLEETGDLLERAGFSLSHSQKFDLIVEYFIMRRRYDVFEINEVLFRYDLPLLGS